VAALLTTLLTVPPAAADDATAEIAERVAQLRAMGVDQRFGSDTRRFAAIETCYNDDEDDVIDFDTQESLDESRGDILQHCVNYGPSLSLTVQMVAPTDPRTDPNWRNATFIGWFIDIDADGQGDYFVDYSLDTDGPLGARVSDIRGADGPVVTCTVAASYTALHGANNIAPACIGNATTIQVSVGVFYDTFREGGANDDGNLAFDSAPGGEVFERPLIQQPTRGRERLRGSGRIGTSIAISQAQFTDGAPSVYLARADLFADAVAGGTLTDGPILLVPNCGALPGEVRAEIDRVNPGRVVALGGEAAICEEVLTSAAVGRTSDRLFGPGRIDTAVEISKEEFPNGADEVYLARADVFADAVVGGVLASGPILLVPTCGALPAVVSAELARLDADVVIALGGVSAVCDDILTAGRTASAGAVSGRLSGPGRIETAVEISGYEFPATADTVYLARADLFADAVAGGVLTDGPILLVPTCGPIPTSVQAEISRAAPDRVVALGGPAAICDEMLDQAVAA
jgi:putative cell wall-binding protein